VVSFLGKLLIFGLVAAFLGACATQPPPITKLVGGRQITTRSVDPTAYEHVSRALLYEEQERWQDAAAEIQRAILFDEDAPELHAHLAELFLRLGRDKDAASPRCARRSSSDQAPAACSPTPMCAGRKGTRRARWRRFVGRRMKSFEAGDDDAESVYLELAEAELHTLDLPSAQSTLEVLTQAEPASATGTCA
jgi:tetratricopeptide (TPR) repeat protein